MTKYGIIDLELSVGDDGKLRYSVTGAAADDVEPFVAGLVRVLNGLKVIARRGDGNVYNLYNPPQPSGPGLRALTRKLKEKLYGRVFPATINIAVTSSCQCKCVHCSADLFQKHGGGARPDLTAEEIRRVVDEGLDLGANLIIFTGGEPLTRPDLPELIRYVDKDRAVPMIFTNGWLLDRPMAARLKEAGLYSLNVSIDELEPSLHDDMRGLPGSHERAFAALKNALDAGILAGVSTYATHENIASGRLAELISMCRDAGAVEVTIFDCIPSGKLLWNRDMVLTEAEKQEVVRLADRFIADPASPMGVVPMAAVNSPSGAGCFGGFSQVYVTCHGDVNPCDFNPISFGSVREFPLQAIWEKMVTHPEFGRRQMTCRMQSARYRPRYIEPIPHDIDFPVPIEALRGDGSFDMEAYLKFSVRMVEIGRPGPGAGKGGNC